MFLLELLPGVQSGVLVRIVYILLTLVCFTEEVIVSLLSFSCLPFFRYLYTFGMTYENLLLSSFSVPHNFL